MTRSQDPSRRRKYLLLFSAPVLLLALLLALKLLSLPFFAGQAASSFAIGHSDGVVRAAHGMVTLNLVEPWKAHFALGDGYALRGDYENARGHFATALQTVSPKESCKVRVNLVLSLEQLGQSKASAGDASAAQALYQEGMDVAKAAPPGCFDPQAESNQDGEGKELNEAQKRLGEKLQSPSESKGGTPSEDARQPADTAPPPTEELQKLQERGSDAQRERAKSGQQTEDYSDAPTRPYAKPW